MNRKPLHDSDFVPQLLADVMRPDVLRPAVSEDTLAQELGVTQGTWNKWKNGGVLPSAKNLAKILEMHRQTVCHHWDCKYLIPLCAIARDYPPSLKEEAMAALRYVLDGIRLSGEPVRRAEGLQVHLHMFATSKLPEAVSAFSYVDAAARNRAANDVTTPGVFFVLVRSDFSIEQQWEMAWREVYAHVVARGSRPDPANPDTRSFIRHYEIRN